jgi:hypothetical protein
MKPHIGFIQSVEATVLSRKGEAMKKGIKLTGHYKIELLENGKVIETREGHNDIVNEGLDNILDVMFNAATQVDPWFVGLIDGSGSQTLANSDTLPSHAGWAELTSYDETTRVGWNPAAAASQQVANGTQMTFTMNATDSIHGIFIASDGTKGGTTGILWATAAFASELAVVATNEVKITYTVTAARG